MNIIDEPKSVVLDDSFSKRKLDDNKTSFIDDNFYKQPSIFDDDFQGIEFPKKEKEKSVMTDSEYFFISGNIFNFDSDD